MGSRFGKHWGKALSLIMAVCLMVTLCPAPAAATLTEDEAQAAVDAWEPAQDEQGGQLSEDGTASAETTVSVSTYSTFRPTEWAGPGNEASGFKITVAESKAANTDNGRLVAKYEGGRPYQIGGTVGGIQTAGKHYVMKLEWTKNGRGPYSLTRPVTTDQAAFTATISLNEVFGSATDEQREGKYAFTMTMIGDGGRAAAPVQFPPFSISDSQFTRDTIDNGEQVPHAVVKGWFAEAAVLNVADITGAQGSAAGTLGMLQDAAGGEAIAEAWQMDIVNGTLLPDPTLYDAATEVTVEVSDATRDQLLGQDSFTIVSLVGGQVHSITFVKDAGSNASPYTYTSTDGSGHVATLTVPDAGKATLGFATEGLGGDLGAFAVAFPAAGSYTVKASATGGTISPQGTVVRPAGQSMRFTLSPLGGYTLDGAVVRFGGAVAPASAYSINGNTLELLPRPAGSTTQLSVEFPPYAPPDPDRLRALPLSIAGACATVANPLDDPVGKSTLAVSYTQLSGGVANPQTVTGSQPQLPDVQEGTPVTIRFQDVLEGYAVKGVRVGASLLEAQTAPLQTVLGDCFAVPAMGTGTQQVIVEYELGVQPPTLDVKHQVTGLAGQYGTVSGTPEGGWTHGSFFSVAVQADPEYRISRVWLFSGTLTEVPASAAGAVADLSAAAAGKGSYAVDITSLTSDMTVVATFERAPLAVDVVQVAGGRLWLTSADAAALPPYEVAYGEPVRFSYQVQEGYRFDGVMVGNAKKSLADLGVADGGSADGSFQLSFAVSTTLTPLFVPEQLPDPTAYAYAVVAADGNGTVSPEGGVVFARGGTLTLNFGTVDGKEGWRAKTIAAVSDAGVRRTVTLQAADDRGSYVFDTGASPWDQLGQTSTYTISVSFADETATAPDPLPEPVRIAIATTAGGQVSPAGALEDGQHVYRAAPGVEQTFALIPDAGYVLDKVWLNVGEGGKMVDVTRASAAGKPYVSGTTLSLTPAAGTSYKLLVEFKKAGESPKVRWNVVTSATAGGSVTPSGTTLVQDGQVAAFTFISQPGYRLERVLVRSTQAGSFDGIAATDMTGMVADGALKLTINGDTQVEAAFALGDDGTPQKETFMLATAKQGEGSVSPAPEAGAQALYLDSSVAMSFKPARGWQLSQVQMGCDALGWSVEVPVSALHEDSGTYGWAFGLPASADAGRFAGQTVLVKAVFTKAPVSHRVTVVTEGPAGAVPSAGPDDAGGYGYVSPGYSSGNAVDVAAGASQMFYFVERPGYVVESVWVGGTRVAGSVQSYLLAGVTADATLRVVFKAQPDSGGTDEDDLLTVRASARGNGSISPAGEVRVPKGGSVMYALIPDDGHRLAAFTVDGVDQLAQASGGTYTLGPVSAAHAVVATFEPDGGSGDGGEERPGPQLRHIYVQVSGPGTVNPGGFTAASALGSFDVPDGGRQTFSFLPDLEAPDGKVNVLDYIEVQRGTGAGALTHRVDNPGGSYSFFNVRADMTLAVHFKQVDKGSADADKPTYARYTVKAQAGKGGTMVPAGDTQVNAGSSLTLRAVADPGYHLSYLAIDGDGAGNAAAYVPASDLDAGCYTFGDIQADHSVRAVFAADGAVGEEGFTAYVIGQDSRMRPSLSGTVQVKEGAPQTLVLTPTFGNRIAAVKLVDAADPSKVLDTVVPAGAPTADAVSVRLGYRADAPRVLVLVGFGAGYDQADPSAVYTVTTTVAPDASGNKLGTVTPGGTQQFPAGADVAFTMVPLPGCTVDAVTANGDPVSFTSVDGYYQFVAHDLSGSLNVVVRFRPITDADGEQPQPGKMASVTFDVKGAGTVQPASPALVKPGDDLVLTLVPKPGAALGTLSVGGRNVTADAVQLSNGSYLYTLRGVQADTVVAATFVNEDGSVDDASGDLDVSVRVEVKVQGNVYGGTVDPSQPITLRPGASQGFLIKPADGFYVADVAVEYVDGRTERPQLMPWQPDYGSGRMRGAAPGAQVQQSAAAQTSQVASVGNANGVQKPYTYVDVADIRTSFVMHVTLDDCMKDPANVKKEYYLYTDAADGLVTVDPSVEGNGTVRPSDNMDAAGPGGSKTLIVEPGFAADGTREELKSMVLNGVPLDLSGSSLRRPDGKQDPQKVVGFITGSGALRPGESIAWVDDPAPGHYELTLKAQQDADGRWRFDQPIIVFTGAGKAYTNRVLVRAFEVDPATGVKQPVDGALLKLTATRLEDGKSVVNDGIDLAYGGGVHVEAELLSDQYELVSIEPDGTGSLTTTPRDQPSDAGQLRQVPENTFYAYGPGSIVATIQKKSAVAGVYYVEATAGKGGTISQPKASYAVGEAATFTLTPDAGYQVASVTLNGGQPQAYTARTLVIPAELCVKDAHVKVQVGFRAAAAGADDPQIDGIKRPLRTLTSLATTGDDGVPVATGLLAVACGALGVAVLVWSRSRNRRGSGRRVLDEE